MTTSPELAVPPCYSTSSPSPIAWCPAVSIASACTGTCSSCPPSRTTDDRSSVRCRSDSGSIKTPMRTVALVPGTASSLTSTTPDTRSSPFLRNVTCPMAGPVRRDGTHGGAGCPGGQGSPPLHSPRPKTMSEVALKLSAPSGKPRATGVTAPPLNCERPTLPAGSTSEAYDAPPRAMKSASVATTLAYVRRFEMARSQGTVNARLHSALHPAVYAFSDPRREVIARNVDQRHHVVRW